MSEITVTVERIEAIEAHPQADRLEIAKIAGTQTVVPKGDYKTGDLCVYFPPDVLLPGDVSERLGVQKYLKTATWEGFKFPCRVAACRLRGTPSYGFVQPLSALGTVKQPSVGTDVTETFHAAKYEPPARVYRGYGGGGGTGEVWGGLAKEPSSFHRYTDIQHYRKYRNLLEPGLPVRITEKIHGTSSRVALLNVDGWQFYAGSHKTARKKIDPEGRESVYWYPLQLEGVLEMLTDLCDEHNDVILFGELYGPGIQDMDYGIPAGEIGWRCYDCSVNGQYLSWPDLITRCLACGVPIVPVLYTGPFCPELVDDLTYGPTTVAEAVKSKFKGREGVVITPVLEECCCIGRLILKSVSADYLDRKGGEDNGEI
jgi:RNA ligase (TIGR02306 family)